MQSLSIYVSGISSYLTKEAMNTSNTNMRSMLHIYGTILASSPLALPAAMRQPSRYAANGPAAKRPAARPLRGQWPSRYAARPLRGQRPEIGRS